MARFPDANDGTGRTGFAVETQPHPGPSQDTEPESTDETDDEQDDGEQDEPSLLDRLASKGKQVADMLAPFTSILTAIVQFVTVRRLVA